MSYDLLNNIEELDLHMQEIIMNCTSEDQFRDALDSHLFAESYGRLFMSRRKFMGNCQDDGTIYFSNVPVGRNESKFKYFAGSINKSKINSMFAQNIAYYNKDPYKELQLFSWLSHPKFIHLIKLSDNIELIADICYVLNNYPKVAPYNAYTIKDLEYAFTKNPLHIYRSWDIDYNFHYSEVINETLNVITNAGNN